MPQPCGAVPEHSGLWRAFRQPAAVCRAVHAERWLPAGGQRTDQHRAGSPGANRPAGIEYHAEK